VNAQTLERALAGATVVLLLSAVTRWYRADSLDAAPAPATVTTRHAMRILSDSALEEAEDLAVSNDPFRLSNTPPDVRYEPAAEGVPGAPRPYVPPPVRPAFSLKAIVGGPPWNAVVDGIPGQPSGTVVRQGAQYERLIVRSVTRDSVIIQGPDTTWVLRFGGRP
jgi:hypothetical protein